MTPAGLGWIPFEFLSLPIFSLSSLLSLGHSTPVTRLILPCLVLSCLVLHLYSPALLMPLALPPNPLCPQNYRSEL
jgi:hypothetical protein